MFVLAAQRRPRHAHSTKVNLDWRSSHRQEYSRSIGLAFVLVPSAAALGGCAVQKDRIEDSGTKKARAGGRQGERDKVVKECTHHTIGAQNSHTLWFCECVEMFRSTTKFALHGVAIANGSIARWTRVCVHSIEPLHYIYVFVSFRFIDSLAGTPFNKPHRVQCIASQEVGNGKLESRCWRREEGAEEEEKEEEEEEEGGGGYPSCLHLPGPRCWCAYSGPRPTGGTHSASRTMK
jgi:hypothetical protein